MRPSLDLNGSNTLRERSKLEKERIDFSDNRSEFSGSDADSCWKRMKITRNGVL